MPDLPLGRRLNKLGGQRIGTKSLLVLAALLVIGYLYLVPILQGFVGSLIRSLLGGQ